jgi:murein DD-endopeptidase MepM/ murein hydrolase activator NlpD
LNNSRTASASAWLDDLARWAHAHPRGIAAAVALVFLSGAGAAVAVANLAPDPAAGPVRLVTESVAPFELDKQAELLDLHRFNLYRTDVTRPTDTADTLLRRLGVNDADASQMLRSHAVAKTLLAGRANRPVRAEVDNDGKLVRLSASLGLADDGAHYKRLLVERRTPGGEWTAAVQLSPLVASARLGSGVIRSSLFAATDEARLPDAVAVQIAEILGGDIDFHRGLRKGDRFSVVYEALEGDGEVLRTGRVLSVEFVNQGKARHAVWFAGAAHDKGAYFTLDGRSMKRPYLSSPMEFSRITSGFAMRMHPILRRWRAHLGVDYAAPTGTPARTVGDGIVEFAGWQNGYGNVVEVRHRNNHTTLYAHLSRILVNKGDRVEQGQHVGLVGATGWATGPHLHFEFRVNGVHQDPMTLAQQVEAVELSAQSKQQFAVVARNMQGKLEAARMLSPASAQ